MFRREDLIDTVIDVHQVSGVLGHVGGTTMLPDANGWMVVKMISRGVVARALG